MAYSHNWDCPHPPGPDAKWQESDCYWFYDANAGVGGYHRIGQRVNDGTATVLLFAFKAGGKRYRLMRDYAGVEASRNATGQRVGSSRVDALGDGMIAFGWDEPGCAADLRFKDPFYTPRGWTAAR